MAGKTAFLERYVRNNLKHREPIANARALMVIGFGEVSTSSDEILIKYADVNGLIGKAAKSARFAYDRNRWALHWFEKMCIRSKMQNRVKAWKAKREKTLCGDKTPGEVYLMLD